jgi:GntR family transcriptional regulator, transcriptional repressor for pyruvate dehydrogenase complex
MKSYPLTREVVTENSQPRIDHFREITVQKPSEMIIQQIRGLILSGVFKPGDRLPSEAALAARFGAGRGHVREAIKRLEFYGILRTIPQSGTVVADLGVKALEGLISNLLNLDKDDFESLMDTRGVLEIHAARLAALHASDSELEDIARTHVELKNQVESGNPGLEEDLVFHLKIAQASRNSVLRSLLSLITPDIIRLTRRFDTCRDGRFLQAFEEHQAILDAIQSRDPAKASEAMAKHMKMVQLERQGLSLTPHPSLTDRELLKRRGEKPPLPHVF